MLTDVLGALFALLFVLGLIALLAWALRRFGLAPGHATLKKRDREIEILETRMIDARSRLVTARWRGKDYFLGVSANGITAIDRDGSKENDASTFIEELSKHD